MFLRPALQQSLVALMMKHFQNVYLRYPDLVKGLKEKPFLAKDTGVHPKLLADWNRVGLLLENHEKNKRHAFSLAEVLWIRMIAKMRDYNLSTEFILALKNSLSQTQVPPISEFMDNDQLIGLIVEQMPPEVRELVRTSLAVPGTLEKALESAPLNPQGMTALDCLMLVALAVDQPVSLIVDHHGNGALFCPILLEESEIDARDYLHMLAQTHVSISITEGLAEALAHAPIHKVHGNIKFLTDTEAQIFTALKEENVSSLMVRFDKEGEADLMEISRHEKVDKGQRLMELMLSRGYQSITLKTQKGKVTFCENTRKVRLK